MPDRLISTAELTAADVPSPNEPISASGDRAQVPEIWEFALTFPLPPTVGPQLLEFVATSAIEHWRKTSELPNIGVDGWRMALLWMYHHWRHTHGDPAGVWAQQRSDETRFTQFLVTEIHRELFEEESWWWQPNHTPSDEERWRRALSRSHEAHDVAQAYELATEMLRDAISARDRGEDDPLNLAIIDQDAILFQRRLLALRLARGLVAEAGGAAESLDVALERAYEAASSIVG